MQLSLRIAFATAVSTGLYGAAMWFPPAMLPFILLVPLPGLILATQAPALACGLWFSLTASAIAMLFGAPAAPGFVLPFGLPTLLLAVGIRRFWSFERTVLAGVVAWCIGSAILAFLAYGGFAAAVTTIREQVNHSIDMAVSTYASLGASRTALEALQANRGKLVGDLIEILPALVVLTGALTVIANLILLRRWTDIARSVNLRLWRAPDVLIWALITTGFAMFLPLPPVAMLARNLFIVVLGCYFCQGLAIVSYYLEHFRLPRGIRIVGYALIAVQHVIMAMVLALGVFDLWGNFRRLNVDPANISFHTDGE